MLQRIVAVGNNSDIGPSYVIDQAAEVQKLVDKFTAELQRTTGVNLS